MNIVVFGIMQPKFSTQISTLLKMHWCVQWRGKKQNKNHPVLCFQDFFLFIPWEWKMYWVSFFNTCALVWQQPFYTILDVKHLGRSWVYLALTTTETCCLHLVARQTRRPIFMQTSSINRLYMRDYERYNCLNEPPAADMMSSRPSEARVNLTFLPASFSPTSTCPLSPVPCPLPPAPHLHSWQASRSLELLTGVLAEIPSMCQ